MSYSSLISITPNAEKVIAYCARVSNSKNQASEKIQKLLKYCIKHSHWSVFEQASATIEINTNRAIARQLLRHRSFCFQEFSQRYSEVPDEPFLFEARLQDLENRQNSIDNAGEFKKEWFKFEQRKIWKLAYASYRGALDRGIAKEQARALLPEGMTPTKLYMTGNLRCWYHFCKLRKGNGSQKEVSEIANQAIDILKQECPILFSLV